MSTTPQVVSSYLSQLEASLRGVDPGVRDEIVAGVREELDGLDATDAAARIEELGDPEFIAAEARSAADPVSEVASGRALPVVAALLVMIGGIVVPFLGALAGLVLVALSPAWTRRQKLIGVIAPFGAALALAAAATLVTLWRDEVHGPGINGYNDLLLPTGADVLFTTLPFVLIFFFVDGVWLLTRVLRRR